MDTVLRTQQPGWQARIEGRTEGRFSDGHGDMRPGADYTIGLLAEGRSYTIQVRAFLAACIVPEARADLHYQGQTVLRHVFERLETGWTPEQDPLPPVIISNPGPGYRYAEQPRLSFFERIFGRNS